MDSSTVPVYIGWPYEVKCERVLSSLPYDEEYYFDDEAITVVSDVILTYRPLCATSPTSSQ